MQHAGFNAIRADILQHHAHLLGDEGGFDAGDAKNTLGILRGQRRDRGGRVTAERGNRFQVRLNARAAPGIRSGYN